MDIIRNPARARPLSANVKRLMKMARESPDNPLVVKAQRPLTDRDNMYCDMQGGIFMAAVDLGHDMEVFAPLFMNSQIAGVIDHSFSCASGMESDSISQMLKLPVLIKSPKAIVNIAVWLDEIVSQMDGNENVNKALEAACRIDEFVEDVDRDLVKMQEDSKRSTLGKDKLPELIDQYSYAYWLGYIYRCECLLHDESSRMVYGAFSEDFMKKTYDQMLKDGAMQDLDNNAAGICRQLDDLLIGHLWNDEGKEQ